MSARMLIALSPAKTLDFTTGTKQPGSKASAPATAAAPLACSFPPLVSDSVPVVQSLKALTKAKVKSTLGISDALAALNFERYKAFELPDDSGRGNEYERAIFAYNGDAYAAAAMNGRTLSSGALEFAQSHLRIISGLYGVVRPLDYIQPYRLCMGTKLAVEEAGSGTTHDSLYSYWQPRIGQHLVKELQSRPGDQPPLIINLASNEYWKAVDQALLKKVGVVVVACAFKNDGRVMSVFAKKARGLMCRFILENQITTIDGLKTFNEEGYQFSPKQSTDELLVFGRKKPAPKGRADAAAAQKKTGKRTQSDTTQPSSKRARAAT